MIDFIVNLSPYTQVLIHSVVTEHSLVSRSSEFEAAIQNGERPLLRTLCDKKLQESEYDNSPNMISFSSLLVIDNILC